MLGRHAAAVVDAASCRLEVFVDDPIFVFSVLRQAARVLLLWQAYGFPLAWDKAQGGKRVSWTGATFDVSSPQLPSIAIEDHRRSALVSELRALLDGRRQTVPRKFLRSLGGSLSQITSIIPYASGFCASFHALGAGGLPNELVLVKQCQHDAIWLLWVLERIPRRPLLLPRSSPDSTWRMETDASLEAMAAVLYRGPSPIAFLVAPVGQADLLPFARRENECITAEPRHQAFLEFNAINIGAQVFLPLVCQLSAAQEGGAVAMSVKGDSVAALADTLRLRGKGVGMNWVGRELCLTAAIHLVHWHVIEHIAGSANFLPDALSRPGAAARHAEAKRRLQVLGARELPLEPREAAFWRTQRSPPAETLPRQ